MIEAGYRVTVVGSLAIGLFSWEAWRGRRRLVGEGGLFASLAVTLVGIGVGRW